MTDEQWKLTEELVSVPYGRATLKADEYNIDILCLPDKPLKYILMVYVNGKVNPEWFISKHEIAERFYCKHKKSLLNQADKANLKSMKKSIRERVLKGSTYEYYTPYFTSFRTLKSHFIKNNHLIEPA